MEDFPVEKFISEGGYEIDSVVNLPTFDSLWNVKKKNHVVLVTSLTKNPVSNYAYRSSCRLKCDTFYHDEDIFMFYSTKTHESFVITGKCRGIFSCHAVKKAPKSVQKIYILDFDEVKFAVTI